MHQFMSVQREAEILSLHPFDFLPNLLAPLCRGCDVRGISREDGSNLFFHFYYLLFLAE